VTIRIDITPRAEQQGRRAREWWRENRSAAPKLFEQEFADVVRLLAEQPDAGHCFPRPRFPEMRRLLMLKTRYLVFYEFQPHKSRVLILAIWSAVRGRLPYMSRK